MCGVVASAGLARPCYEFSLKISRQWPLAGGPSRPAAAVYVCMRVCLCGYMSVFDYLFVIVRTGKGFYTDGDPCVNVSFVYHSFFQFSLVTAFSVSFLMFRPTITPLL